MPKDKEWSAVAALLNQINELKERIETLEIYTWAYMTRWIDRTSDAIWYRTPRERITTGIPEWIDTNQPIAENNIPYRNVTMSGDGIMYATTDDNITIPLTWISWHYGWTAYCTSSHI